MLELEQLGAGDGVTDGGGAGFELPPPPQAAAPSTVPANSGTNSQRSVIGSPPRYGWEAATAFAASSRPAP